MHWKAGISIAAVILLAGGCGGRGGEGGNQPPISLPPPPPPVVGGNPPGEPSLLGVDCDAGADRGGARGGLWAGHPQEDDSREMRLLVAETGEFHWISPDSWDQKFFGTFQSGDDSFESDDALWVWVDGLTWLETEFVGVNFSGGLDGESNLSLSYETESDPERHGTLSFAACNSVYTRDSSLAAIAGTYVGGEMTLAIDAQGEIFLQDRTCTGSGSVELIDPDFNMYRMQLEVSVCAGNEVYATGTFSGLAYLGDSGPGFAGDVLEYSLTAAKENRALIWTRQVRR
jgi:hypothetical protein